MSYVKPTCPTCNPSWPTCEPKPHHPELCARQRQLESRTLSKLTLNSKISLHAPREVPPSGTANRLPPETVARIRSQAFFSAEIARATQDDRTVRLIEEQYTEFRFLKTRFRDNEEDLLLASILHVVDAFDAVTFPRPYQQDVPDEIRLDGLLLGQGTLFHPDVIDQLCELDLAA